MSRSVEQLVEVMTLEDDDEDDDEDGDVQWRSSAATDPLEEEDMLEDSDALSDVSVNSSSRRMSGSELGGGSVSNKSLLETEDEEEEEEDRHEARADDLYNAVCRCDWDTARKLFGTSNARDLVEYVSPKYPYDSALHATLFRGVPSDIIQSILNTSETAPLRQSCNGWTPLHWAICYSSDEIIIILLGACPRAASIATNSEQTPLHRAIDNNKSPEVIRHLLTANPTAATATDDDGDTPLRMLYEYWNVPLRNTLESIDGEKRELHKTFLLLLQAATHGSIEDHPDSQFRPLHTAIIDPCCPWSFVRLILRMHPKEASQWDREGLLPIHVAAAAISSAYGERLHTCNECECRIQNASWYTRKSYRWIVCLNCFKQKHEARREEFNLMKPVDKIPAVIRDLLKTNLEFAKIPDGEGRLPLHIAIESEKSFDAEIKKILQAAPKGVNTRDVKTHLYPFLLAAVTHDRTGNRLNKFASCFALLMDDPHCVSYGILH